MSILWQRAPDMASTSATCLECKLANFDFDQAEGLRRMLAGPRPRIVTFLSASPQDDKGTMLVNLGASLAPVPMSSACCA